MEAHQLSLSFVKQLKQQILTSRYAVAKLANAESLRLYFSIGEMVDDEFNKNNWGAKVNNEIAQLLQQELPGLRGFSGESIKKMRRFYKEWHLQTPIWSTVSTKLEIPNTAKRSLLTTKLEDTDNDEGTIHSSVTSKLENGSIDAFLSTLFSHHYEIILKTKTLENLIA